MELCNAYGEKFEGTPKLNAKGRYYHSYIGRCTRCGGAGGWSGWPGFTCYRCGGSGREYEPTIVQLYTPEQYATLLKRRAAVERRRLAKQEAELAALRARRAALLETLPAAVRSMVESYETDAGRDALAARYGHVVQDIAGNVWAKAYASERQIEVLQEAFDRAAAREAAKEARRAGSQHVGTVGERSDFVLTVEKVFSFTSDYGWPRITTYINLCRDAAGNVVVYKGSNGWSEGETLTVKATVKEHGERDGVKQTIIQRPKVLA